MARIETDPNYSSPTFSRATAATDIFKKEDVQGVSAAMSTHDHASGKGLAVTRLGTLNQDVSFSNGGAKLIADALTVTAFAANTAGTMHIVPSGSGGQTSLQLWPTPTKANAPYAQIYCGPTDMMITAGKDGTGVYGKMLFTTSGTTRLTIQEDGTISMGGLVSVGSFISNDYVSAVGYVKGDYLHSATGTIYLVDATTGYIVVGGGQVVTRSPNGLNVQNLQGGLAPVTCGVLTASSTVNAQATLLLGPGAPQNIPGARLCLSNIAAGPQICLYDAGANGWMSGFGIASGEINCSLIGSWRWAWRQYSSGGTVIGYVDFNGQMGCGANFSPASSGTVNGSYAISCLNAAAANGMGLAYAWPVHSSVAHAREYGLPIEQIAAPTAKVLALSPYAYEHVSFDSESKPLTRGEGGSGGLVSTPTYGFAATEVAEMVPEAVTLDEDGTVSGVDPYRLLCVLWASVQDVTNRLAALETGGTTPA